MLLLDCNGLSWFVDSKQPLQSTIHLLFRIKLVLIIHDTFFDCDQNLNVQHDNKLNAGDFDDPG